MNKRIKKASKWYLETRLPEYKINLALKTISQKNRKSYYGWCTRKNRNTFVIVLPRAKDGIVLQLQTLFHELTHLNQFVTGKLSPDLKYWCGKKYSNTRYRFRPWEIEAHAVERSLTEYYMLLEGVKK